MAQLRGGFQFWSAGDSVANAAASPLCEVGPSPWVAVYLANEHASIDTVFKVQVAGTASPEAGRNALTDDDDGGLTWFDYQVVKSDGTFAVLTFTLTHGLELAYDLSPFGPQFIRLLRTDSNGANTAIEAFLTAFGPS